MTTPTDIKKQIDADLEYFRAVESPLLADGLPSTSQVETLYLNRYGEIDNPEPAKQLPKPFTFDDAVACMSDATLSAMSDQTYEDFQSAVNAGTLRTWQRTARIRNKITADEQAKIVTLLDATTPDSSHPAKVPAEHIDGLSALINEALGRPLESSVNHPDIERIIGRLLTADEQAARDAHFAEVSEQADAAKEGLSVEAFRAKPPAKETTP